MKKWLSLLLALCMLATLSGALAESSGTEALSVTHHTAQIAGQTLSYTATTGRMMVEMEGSQAQMFFTAYTLDGVENLDQRPITFAFSGGPGAASLYLHLGMLGPRRVDVNGDGAPTGLPTGLVDNPCSILDMTDLVFIDPVGTGYSRAMKGTDPSDFWNYDADIISVSKFIRLYTSLYGRWGSPKYLSGESYGTVRAVGVADYLATQYDLYVNGAMLISSINDMNTALNGRDDSTDLSYVLTLPSYAAIAWYHGLLDEKYQSMSLEDYMTEVREFAGGDYQHALFKGTHLSQVELDDITGRIAAYIGLKKEAVIHDNLRVYVDDFCSDLLSDRELTVGCLDGRLTGYVTDGRPIEGDADPSSTTFGTAFGSAINNYFAGELGYQTDLLYVSVGQTPYSEWKYNRDNQALDQKKLIRNTMTRNRFMKVWVLCGYYDLSTPFFAAEWVYDHVFLNPENRENLSFTYYPAGHMIYMHQPSLEQFRKDAEAWYNAE